MKIITSLILYFICLVTFANTPALFLFIGKDEASAHIGKLHHSYVSGAQIIYSWHDLEPSRNVYNFTKIYRDLATLNHVHKKLFIQIQDRSFQPHIFNVPDYIRNDPQYHGGVAQQFDHPGEGLPVGSGWVARVWDGAVQRRFQLLLKQLAYKFDGKIYGINLPETAVDFNENDLPADFTATKYFFAEYENIAYLRKVFRKAIVLQYVNFFPAEWSNDHQYMSRLFDYAGTHNIALGGPDTIPYRNAHMQNSYSFFNQYKNKLLVGMAIQEPDYTYKNPATGTYYTAAEFYDFAQNYLGARLLFWNITEPFFSRSLMPYLTGKS